MFKFVTQSPKQVKATREDTEQARNGFHATRPTSAEALFFGLDKHKTNKTFVTTKRKNCGDESLAGNRGLDQARPSSVDAQLNSKQAKTNADLSLSRYTVHVTLEENEADKNVGGNVTARNAAGDPNQTLRSDSGKRSSGHDPTEVAAAGFSQGKEKLNWKEKAAIFGRNGYRKVIRKLSAETSEENSDAGVFTAHSAGVRMTQDYYSMSDSESDGAWLDQPSPIRLTASPPINAVRVPATKFVSAGFAGNGFTDPALLPHENGFLTHPGEESLEKQASNLFFSSLRRSTQNAKAVFAKPSAVKRLLPQEPHSYSRKNAFAAHIFNNGKLKKNGGPVPTSGAIFVGGPLFLTEETADEEYDEKPRDNSFEDTIVTEQTRAGIPDRISSHNDAAYRSDMRINMRKDNNHLGNVIKANHAQKHAEENGVPPQQHKTSTSKDFVPHNGLIGVENAKDRTAHDNARYREPQRSVDRSFTGERHGQHPSDFSAAKNAKKNKSAIAGFKASMFSKRKPGVRGQREHRSSLNHDDDDDATTLTMTTASDYGYELSSTSSDSESTECGSVDSARLGGRDPADSLPTAADDFSGHVDSGFVIRKVERITSGESLEYETSPEEERKSHHFAYLQRSISTQSGKLRDRLNATTDDEGSLFQVTPRGSEYFTAETSPESGPGVGDFKPSKSTTSEQAMPSLSEQHSPTPGSPVIPHSRVSQLKGDGGYDRPRRSRTLTRVPATQSPPGRSLRSRSLDRAFRSSFTRAISPSRSEFAGLNMRSRSNSATRRSADSYSEGSDSLKRGSVRRTPSAHSLNEQYRPKIDVATSLSALILNPANGGENDRKTIQDYLKQSSRSSSQDRLDASPSLRFSRWGSDRLSASPGRSPYSTPGSTLDRKLNLGVFTNDDDVSELSRLTVQSTPSRESKVISKSQTPNRYPAVEVSPRPTMSSLLPSPRPEADSDVITIVDNDAIASQASISDHDGARRNSFIEAVSGGTGESHSTVSVTPHEPDEDAIEGAFNEFTIAARESILNPSPQREWANVASNGFTLEGVPATPPASPQNELKDEVNVNLSKHPVSKDLAVAVIRRRSTNDAVSPTKVKNTISSKKAEKTRSNGLRKQPAIPTRTLDGVAGSGHQERIFVNHLRSPEDGDSLAQITAVNCRNPRCRQQMSLEDGESRFKSCHHCYTYYCSQQCRLQHWEKHKMKCVFARANSDCKKILRMGREDDVIKQAFTRVARTGYLSRGRGCVLVEFSTPDRAEHFISEGLFALESLPVYLTVDDIRKKSEVFDENDNKAEDKDKSGLAYTCDTVYNPDESYVLQIHIGVPEEVIARYERPYRHRDTQGVIIHAVNPIYRSETSPGRIPSYAAPETLILTPPTTVPEMSSLTSPPRQTYSNSTSSSPGASPLDSATPVDNETPKLAKRARQLSFINIQRKLREKGVTLRHQYPDVYRKLCAYVDTATNFTPVVIYPRDSRSGKNFMCLVMPGSEPQILGWVQTPGLLDDIATG